MGARRAGTRLRHGIDGFGWFLDREKLLYTPCVRMSMCVCVSWATASAAPSKGGSGAGNLRFIYPKVERPIIRTHHNGPFLARVPEEALSRFYHVFCFVLKCQALFFFSFFTLPPLEHEKAET